MDFSFIEAVKRFGSIRRAAREIGIPKSTFYDNLQREKEREQQMLSLSNPLDLRKKKGKSVYFITTAQNDTPIFGNFLKTLNVYKDWYEGKGIEARLIVVPITYWNLFENQRKKKEPEWDERVREYLLKERVILHDDLILCGEMDINPTATHPLSGLDNYTSDKWGIFPHTRVSLRSLPTFKKGSARQLMTTGALTKQNYIPKKTGMKAFFHHVFGAVVVEIDHETNHFWTRHILPDGLTGEFYDISRLVTLEGVKRNPGVPGVVYGDVHAERVDKNALDIANELSMELRAERIILHDLIDFWARSHHTINDGHERFRIHSSGMDNVEDAFKITADVISNIHVNTLCKEIVIVDSNHHSAFVKWLNTGDYRNDPTNAIFFLKAQLHYYEAMKRGVEINIFEDVLRKYIDSDISTKFLRADESYTIKDIEVGVHGHLGVNGARGNPRSFSRLGVKAVTGHTHSPSIHEGVYTVGCLCQMDMGYNKGPSSWMHSVCVIYPNGKRTLVTFSNRDSYAMDV